MRRNVLFSSRVGDRWTFAVEFEGIGDPPKSWRECWGSLWLWVDGQVVGYPFEIEMVMTGFDSLMESAQEVRTENSGSLQASVDAKDALDLVMRSLYGDEDSPNEEFMGDASDLARCEVLPRLTGSFFDGWEAVLIRVGDVERFVFRSEGAEAREAVWPAGAFTNVIQLAIDEFKRFALALQAR